MRRGRARPAVGSWQTEATGTQRRAAAGRWEREQVPSLACPPSGGPKSRRPSPPVLAEGLQVTWGLCVACCPCRARLAGTRRACTQELSVRVAV